MFFFLNVLNEMWVLLVDILNWFIRFISEVFSFGMFVYVIFFVVLINKLRLSLYLEVFEKNKKML